MKLRPFLPGDRVRRETGWRGGGGGAQRCQAQAGLGGEHGPFSSSATRFCRTPGAVGDRPPGFLGFYFWGCPHLFLLVIRQQSPRTHPAASLSFLGKATSVCFTKSRTLQYLERWRSAPAGHAGKCRCGNRNAQVCSPGFASTVATQAGLSDACGFFEAPAACRSWSLPRIADISLISGPTSLTAF